MAILACAAFAAFGCSKTATTRGDQEAEFKDLFGMIPSSAVADIRYYESSSAFGGWSRWMSFSYDAPTYEAVLKMGGYKLSEVSYGGAESGAPVWWPKEAPPQSALYSRHPEDTPEDEGYQFWEFIWHDPSSRQVYFTKSYWD